MNLVIMGPAGSGKGTQSEKIVSKFGLVHLSTGDMFRSAIALESEVGLIAKKYIDQGQLVPDEVTINVVKERLLEKDVLEKGFLLDGFPRTIPQAKALLDILKEINLSLDLVLDLNVNPDELLSRVEGRRVCKTCGAIYHIKNNPPKVAGICDIDNGELYQRSDDTKEGLEVRLSEYYKSTKPIVNYFKDFIKVEEIKSGSIEEVFTNIEDVLGKINNDFN